MRRGFDVDYRVQMETVVQSSTGDRSDVDYRHSRLETGATEITFRQTKNKALFRGRFSGE
jgi:hypothetical protein